MDMELRVRRFVGRLRNLQVSSDDTGYIEISCLFPGGSGGRRVAFSTNFQADDCIVSERLHAFFMGIWEAPGE